MARMVEENDTELDVLKSRIHEGDDSREWKGEHHDLVKTSEDEEEEERDEEGEQEEERDDDHRERGKMLLHEVVQDGTCQAVIEPGMEEWKEVSTEERSATSLNNPEGVIMMSPSLGLKLAVNCSRDNGAKRKGEGRSCNNTIIDDNSSATQSNCITSHPVSHSACHLVTPPISHSKSPPSAPLGCGSKSTRTVSSYVSLSNKIRRAKRRTVRMSITIIAAFLICWTPYVIVVFWYQIDEESAKRFDQYTKDGLFTFAVANSCLNPIVYGSHLIKSACQRSTNRLAGDRTTGGIERPVHSRFTKRSIIIDSTGNTV